MPPKSATPNPNNRNIQDFFKPFTIPKSRIPRNDTIEDEIVVAPGPAHQKRNQTERGISPKKDDQESTQFTELSLGSEDERHPTVGGAATIQRDRPANLSQRPSNAPTSARAPELKQPGRSAVTQLESRSDDPLLHISPPDSQQRTLSAVEISSPSIPSRMLPPTREDTNKGLNASFSSISTLSSVPASSQSSSRRIVKNGILAVTNSDSGSEDSSSDDDLADVSDLVPRKRKKLTPPEQDRITDPPSTVKPARRGVRVSGEAKRFSGSRTSPSPPRMLYKHSLAKMVKQRQKQEKTEVRIREAEEAFEASIKQREHEVKEQDFEEGLADAIADDSDQGERMKLAIARTELLQEVENFHFFRGRRKPKPGPWNVPPSESAFAHFANKDARERACTSGLLAQLADVHDFPEEARTWVVQQLTEDTRHDICTAYVEMLRASGNAHPVIRLQDFYHNSLSTDSGNVSNGAKTAATAYRGLPPGLQYALDVVRDSCISNIDFPREVVPPLTELMISMVDDDVQGDITLLQKYQDAVAQIIQSFTSEIKFDELCKLLLTSPLAWGKLPRPLQCRMIASMPALSMRCHQLRRFLATYLVTDSLGNEECDLDLTLAEWNNIVLQRIKSAPDFAVSDTSDYSLLTSLVFVLDIAVDSGFSDHVFEPLADHSVKAPGLFARPSQRSTDEATFNAQIDALTKELTSMSSRIRDAGSTHLKRTEAKMAIDRLVLRLEWCVRTKPAPKKYMFGESVQQQRNFLHGFLKKTSMDDKADERDHEPEAAALVAPEELADGDHSTITDGRESVYGSTTINTLLDE